MSYEALDRAIAKFPSQKAFADALEVKSPSVSEWRARERVPAERCRDIEKLTGVTAAELRPDLFGDDEARAA